MTDTNSEVATVPVTINGTEIAADPGELLIDAAERHGVYIPRFCYHGRMKPVGMCRMCLVEVDAGRGPALQPSCMIPVAPGMTVDTQSDATVKAQEGVLEFLLINHPLDCPVCDKGGECPLQDQTVAFGPGESRFVEEKRHNEKPIPISETVLLDRERCILCDRCTRFAKEVAGDPLIHFMNRGGQTEVNTFPDEPFSSYFSGNTVQICPVGALTAKPYRFRARPWDLDEVESTATTDSVGSRIVIQSSRNQVLRVLGVDSEAVNWGWLSDVERFNFEAINSEHRLTQPAIRDADAELVSSSWGAAAAAVTDKIKAALDGAGAGSIASIGGARLTNEAQYAWARLLKGVIGTDHVDAQLGDGLPAELVLSMPRATIAEACRPGGIIILLGPDPKEELGALFLRLRHAIVEDGATLIELTPGPTGLSPHTRHRLHSPTGTVADVATALVKGGATTSVAGVDPGMINAAHDALGAGPVTIILGRTSVTEHPGVLADAARALSAAHPDARYLSTLRRGNIHGALDMGLAPGVLPGRVTLAGGEPAFTEIWGSVPGSVGMGTADTLRAADEGGIEVLFLLGADPLVDFPDRALAERALAHAHTVIAIDLFVTESAAVADIVLPAAGFAEVGGTTTNLEGRVSVLNPKVTPPGTARPDWMIAAELASRLGSDFGFDSDAAVWEQVTTVCPSHGQLGADALAGVDAEDGLLVGAPGSAGFDFAAPAAVTGVSEPEAGSLRLTVGRKMYGASSATRHSPSLVGLAPGTTVRMHPENLRGIGVDTGEPVVVRSARGSVIVPVQVDPSIPLGSVWMTGFQSDVTINDLLNASDPITDVRIEAVHRTAQSPSGAGGSEAGRS